MGAAVDMHAWEQAFLDELEPDGAPGAGVPDVAREAVLIAEVMGYLVQRPEPWEVALKLGIWWRRIGGQCETRWVAARSVNDRIRGIYGRAKYLPEECWRRDGKAIKEVQVIGYVNRVLRRMSEGAALKEKLLDTGKVTLSPAGEALLRRLLPLMFFGEVREGDIGGAVDGVKGDVVMATKRVFLLASAFVPHRIFHALDSHIASLFGETRAAVSARMLKLFDPLGIRVGIMKKSEARGAYSERCTQKHEEKRAALESLFR